jgi:hypothetical protein
VKHSQGLWDSQSFDETKRLLVSSLDSFVEAHQQVTSTFAPTTPYQQWWNTANMFPVSLLQNGEPVTRNNTLNGIVSETISSAQVIVSLAQSNCTMDNKFVYFVVHNYGVVHDALQANIRLRFEKYYQDFSTFGGTVRSQ